MNGAKNAAILAIQMLALSDDALADKLAATKQSMIEGVKEKDSKMQQMIAELN